MTAIVPERSCNIGQEIGNFDKKINVLVIYKKISSHDSNEEPKGEECTS